MEEKERYYKLSYDVQKWMFSKYTKDTHFEDVITIQRALAETVCTMNYNIIGESPLYHENREKLFDIAKRHDYEIVEINLEAEYEVLLTRFDERVADALAKKSKTIANTSHERFQELYDIYQADKNPSALTLKTDLQTPEEIFESILKMI